MNCINDTDFLRLIKDGRGEGAFLFYGEEAYLKQHCINVSRKDITEDSGLAAFNCIKITEETYTPEELTDAIMSPPVMCSAKQVELHGIDLNSMKDGDLEELCSAADNARELSGVRFILMTTPGEFDPGYDKRPTKLYKALTEHMVPVYFGLQTDAKLTKWILRHFNGDGVVGNEKTAAALIARCGHDMQTLSGELTKLSSYVLSQGRTDITEDDIKKVVCQRAEIGAFEFANVCLSGDCDRALEILGEKKSHREKPEMIFSQICGEFVNLMNIKTLADGGMTQGEIATALKMKPFRVSLYQKRASSLSYERVEKALSLCSAADVKLKSSPSDNYMELEKLILSLKRI